MPIKTPLKLSVIALVLGTAPSFSLACDEHTHDTTAASCMAGTVWDSAKQACVERTTS